MAPIAQVLILAVTEDWAECKRSRKQQSPRHMLVNVPQMAKIV